MTGTGHAGDGHSRVPLPDKAWRAVVWGGAGILLLLRGAELARVFVAEGRIIKVETTSGNGVPRERMMRLLDWRDGQFEFSPAAVGGQDEVGVAISGLLLEHARISDEDSAGSPPRR